MRFRWTTRQRNRPPADPKRPRVPTLFRWATRLRKRRLANPKRIQVPTFAGEATGTCVACGSPRWGTEGFCSSCMTTLLRLGFKAPPRPPTKPSQRVKRAFRRMGVRRVKQLRRRLKEARKVLDVLMRDDLPRGAEREDTIRRWIEYDEASMAHERAEFLDDLSILYPNATDAELERLADRFRVRPSKEVSR